MFSPVIEEPLIVVGSLQGHNFLGYEGIELGDISEKVRREFEGHRPVRCIGHHF
jgi:hypothetical protein